MAHVYLETSFVSACVTTRQDPASIYRRQTSNEWMQTQAARHQLFVSAEVFRELDHPDYAQRTEALAFIAGTPVLAVDEEASGLARILVQERVMPGPPVGDAVHVAVACVHGIDYLLTWNVRHLANPNKLSHLRTVCLRVGRIPPAIITPDLLWEDES